MNDPVLDAVNEVRRNLGHTGVDRLSDDVSLREDLLLDSLALAELTVRIEASTGVDVFADGIVATVGEVREKLSRADRG